MNMKGEMLHRSTFLRFGDSDGTNGSCDDTKYFLVILNYNLPKITLPLWRRAQLRICADGGANRLYDGVPEALRKEYVPDVVKGDLDSIRSEVRSFYEGLGSEIVDESHDQDTTDLHKCISYIDSKTQDLDKSKMKILVVGALGGRLDHEFGNLNVLYVFATLRVILLNDDCMTYLLRQDFNHKIHIDFSVEGKHCGLVPLGAPSACTTTTGLKWNMDKTCMQFGGLISVCNQTEDEIVSVSSDANLIWTITINARLQDYNF